MSRFNRPDKNPTLDSVKRILITGASGGLGRALIEMFVQDTSLIIGAHGRTTPD